MTKRIDYKKKFEDFKANLIDEYEERFDDYKAYMAETFSDFVDAILEEELTIPDKVITYAKCGELYDDLMKQFKVRLGIDAGLIDGEVKDMMRDAKQEIIALRDKLNKTMGATLEVQKDYKDMAAELYKRQQIALYRLPENSTLKILEDEIDIKVIDAKIHLLLNGPIAEARDELVEENAALHSLLRKMLKV